MQLRRGLKVAMAGGLFVLHTSANNNNLGFDPRLHPEKTLEILKSADLNGSHGRWLRLRGMHLSPTLDSSPNSKLRHGESIESVRQILTELRARGHSLVSTPRWHRSFWSSSTRADVHDSRLPLDLREVYTQYRTLAHTYADLIDAWEVYNEPDTLFVPENAESFAAFYKAAALGIRDGRAANMTLYPNVQRAASLVMHSPGGLPPGPYWAELVKNDTFKYTECFNYHFYGEPDGFPGLRDQWIAEVNTLAGQNLSELPSMPIFLTEYGYGHLESARRNTWRGRMDQANWYNAVIPHIIHSPITGAMAFALAPRETDSTQEFGLLAKAEPTADITPQLPRESTSLEVSKLPTPRPTSDHNQQLLNAIRPEELPSVVLDLIASQNSRSVKRYSGHLLSTGRPGQFLIATYNFDSNPVEGSLVVQLENGQVHSLTDAEKVTTIESASPAGRKRRSRPKPIPPEQEQQSPLKPVIENWPSARSDYFATPKKESFAITPALELLTHAAHNFPTEVNFKSSGFQFRPTVAGGVERRGYSPQVGEQNTPNTNDYSKQLRLAPFSRKITAISVQLSVDSFEPSTLAIRWVPKSTKTGSSILRTQIYPNPRTFRLETVEHLHERLTTPVSENSPVINVARNKDDHLWSFRVSQPESTSLQPFEAEYALPKNWKPRAENALAMRFRLVTENQNPRASGELSVILLSQNGNRFSVWPRTVVNSRTQHFLEPFRNFTPINFGSNQSPMTFADQIWEKLIIEFRTASFPAILEIQQPRIVVFTPLMNSPQN